MGFSPKVLIQYGREQIVMRAWSRVTSQGSAVTRTLTRQLLAAGYFILSRFHKNRTLYLCIFFHLFVLIMLVFRIYGDNSGIL